MVAITGRRSSVEERWGWLLTALFVAVLTHLTSGFVHHISYSSPCLSDLKCPATCLFAETSSSGALGEKLTATIAKESVATTNSHITAVVGARRAPTRTGLGQKLLDMVLNSWAWKFILVPQARQKIVDTAEANNIPWTTAKAWIQSQMEKTYNLNEALTVENNADPPSLSSSSAIPDYYKKEFHAYIDGDESSGNLCWDAALEVEIASCAVGSRNFPRYGSKGEQAFRGAFDSALIEAGARVPSNGRICDFGCGTGMSTRRLAKNFPQADSIFGVDLSPYFIAVGKRLLELAPSSFDEGGPWVSTIEHDSRIKYLAGDAAEALKLPELEEESVDVVNIQFVFHELPPRVARNMVDEAFRLLKPQGQVWICEMDFEAPAYAAQRANPLLFSLIRSTEPYLDDYAESISDLFEYIQAKSEHVKVVPATGRHFALIATKGKEIGIQQGIMEDLRFDEDGKYRVEDTHLQLWESKQ
jgi:ubiquinone/menaquinone biosynthesis C-methylase UbiE